MNLTVICDVLQNCSSNTIFLADGIINKICSYFINPYLNREGNLDSELKGSPPFLTRIYQVKLCELSYRKKN